MADSNRTARSKLQRPLIPEDRPTPDIDTVEGYRIDGVRQPRSLRRKAATAALAAISVAVCLYAVIGHDGVIAYLQKRQHSKQLQHQIISLRQQNETLSKRNQRLQNDPDTIEYEAREQMHYARPGEVIYTLSEAPGSAGPTKSK
jgi:cell division protein FtsB